jgi:hypothetical protein
MVQSVVEISQYGLTCTDVLTDGVLDGWSATLPLRPNRQRRGEVRIARHSDKIDKC